MQSHTLGNLFGQNFAQICEIWAKFRQIWAKFEQIRFGQI